MIRIRTLDCPGFKLGSCTRAHRADGAEIKSVAALDLRSRPDELLIVTVCVEAVDIFAHPLLGLETVRAAARAHGFRPEPIPTTETGDQDGR